MHSYSKGADVEVNVESDPETMVHLLAMDESLEIMRTGNRITKSDVLDALETISEEEPEQYSNCYSRCYSRNDIFHDLPIIYISNLENEHQLGMDMADCAMDFVPRPLFANANSSFLMKKCLIDTDRFGVQPLQPPPVKQARKNFAETWLWRSSIVK